jgi:lysophospholipase L1-like esterase
VLLLMAVSAFAAGCGGSSSPAAEGGTPGSGVSQQSSTWKVVALGDSDTTGKGDATGLGWVERYTRLLRQRVRGTSIEVTNLAAEGNTSEQLLTQVQSDPATRRQIAEAKVVLLGIGGADLNAGDTALQAGRCHGQACYAPLLRRFGRNFQATVSAIQKLRGGHPTVLRAITLPNALPGAQDVIPPFVTEGIAVYQSRTEKQAICGAMAEYRGRCIDLLRAFNGPSGTENAYKKGLMNHSDCCYPSAQGQQLIAELLLRTGLAPLT